MHAQLDDLVIVNIGALHPDAVLLIAELDAELAARYGNVDDGRGAFRPADVQGPRGAFVVARLGGKPVGCGALRPLDDGGSASSAEVKRMYVASEARGRGVARAILGRLEALARGFGYARLVLETGDRQPEAIRLYERAGFARIPCYGQYAGQAWSVCFEKTL